MGVFLRCGVLALPLAVARLDSDQIMTGRCRYDKNSLLFLGQYRPALIPWSELYDPQPAILHLQRAVCLTVGSPQLTTLTCTRRLFETMQPYLD
jgi:hypothetical protein